ncbi:hypothetical protein AMECASPLE_022915 [Ameca splendens]|uniref:Uncharacterized protein n=1 Tax=Ameca splendens TaxID=208324 RepID=A0ABV0ZDQ1_9TELE
MRTQVSLPHSLQLDAVRRLRACPPDCQSPLSEPFLLVQGYMYSPFLIQTDDLLRLQLVQLTSSYNR